MAIWALECLINEMGFDSTFESFEPMIDPVIGGLFQWLGRCKTAESQLKILSSFGILIEGISSHVQPYALKILEMLSDLWSTSGELLMQAAIIRTFSKLVVSLSGDATHFYQHLIPIIDYSTKVGERSSDNGLLEDGILLWLCTLRSATEFSQELLDLFGNLRAIIDGGLEKVILQLSIKLVESYILLGQIDFLQAHVDEIASIFFMWIGDTKDDMTNEVIRPLEVMLMLYPEEMPVHFEPLLIKLVHLMFSGEESDLALCYYVHFFNRLLLHNPDFFLSFLHRAGDGLIDQFINQFTIGRIDQLGDLRRRKVAAMALSNLICTQLLQMNPDMVALATQEIIGVVCDELAGEGPEYLVRPDETNIADEIFVPELKSNSVQARQLEHLYRSDPVNKFNGKDYLLSQFEQAGQNSPDAFHHMLSLVEPLVLQSLESTNASSVDSDGESPDQ